MKYIHSNKVETEEDFFQAHSNLEDGTFAEQEDFLKYLPAVRYYLCRKNDIRESDLDWITFLYSERRFNLARMQLYNTTRNIKYSTLDRLLNLKLIYAFKQGPSRRFSIYELTPHAKRIVKEMYDVLQGRLNPNRIKYIPSWMGTTKKDKRTNQVLKELSFWAKTDKEKIRREMQEAMLQDIDAQEARVIKSTKAKENYYKKKERMAKRKPKNVAVRPANGKLNSKYKVRVIRAFNPQQPQYPVAE
jgi:hypothetical protein